MASSSSPPGGNNGDNNGGANSGSLKSSSAGSSPSSNSRSPHRPPRGPLTAMQLFLYVHVRRLEEENAQLQEESQGSSSSDMVGQRRGAITLDEVQTISREHREGRRMGRLRSLLPRAAAARTTMTDNRDPSFMVLSRWMSEQWRTVDPSVRRMIQEQAQRDRATYLEELEAWRRSRGGGATTGNRAIGSLSASSVASLMYLQSLSESGRTGSNSGGIDMELQRNFDWSSGNGSKS